MRSRVGRLMLRTTRWCSSSSMRVSIPKGHSQKCVNYRRGWLIRQEFIIFFNHEREMRVGRRFWAFCVHVSDSVPLRAPGSFALRPIVSLPDIVKTYRAVFTHQHITCMFIDIVLCCLLSAACMRNIGVVVLQLSDVLSKHPS